MAYDFKNPHEIVTSTVPVFFFIWDVQKRKVVYVSKKFYDLAGDITPLKNQEDLKNYFDPEFHEKYDAFFNALSAKNDYTNQLEIKANDLLHGIRWIEIRTYPVDYGVTEKDKAIKLVVGHLMDITEKKEKISSLEGENQNFDNMMQMISHDLRQPFTKITLLAEMIHMESGGNEELNEYAVKIKEATHSAHKLLEDFLQLTALNYSNQMLSTVNENLGDIIMQAVNEFDEQLDKNDLNLNLDLPSSEFIYPVEPTLFKQLIMNIISNAVKFTPAEGSLSVELVKSTDFYKISVSDTGIGIPDDLKSKLFTEVTAVRRKGLDGQKSTGIGLAISKRIAELHHATIEVESEEGKGSKFTVLLPLKPHLHT